MHPNDTSSRFSLNRKHRKYVVLLAVLVAVGVAFATVPALTKKSEQSYICTKKTGKKPPRHIINITFVEKGRFTKTCVSSQRKRKVIRSDCGKALANLVEKGFNCKRTRLNLN